MTSHAHAAHRIHLEPIRIRYGDTDQMGVVYYANYLRFFEIARAEWLRAGGTPYKQIEDDGWLFPVIEAHVRYRQPARYDDVIEIECTPSAVGAATMRFNYIVRRESTVLAEGYTQHACIDRGGRPRRFPPSVRAILSTS